MHSHPPPSFLLLRKTRSPPLRWSNSSINTNPTIPITNRKPPIPTSIEARELRIRDTVWYVSNQEARSGAASHKSRETAIGRVDAGDTAVISGGNAIDLLHGITAHDLADGKAVDGAEEVIRSTVGVICCGG